MSIDEPVYGDPENMDDRLSRLAAMGDYNASDSDSEEGDSHAFESSEHF